MTGNGRQDAVQWEFVDYGLGAFHVASYRREEPAVEAAPEADAEVTECCWRKARALPLFRCWAASWAGRTAA